MPVSPAREIAYQILRRVESGRAFAVDLLQRSQVSELREVDRNLATELVMGALRWHGELDFQIERLSGKPLKYFDPEIATILRLGVYQIRFLEKIPKSAVVNEAVELAKSARKRSAAGLVNAVLRKCEPPPRRVAAVEKDDARSLPGCWSAGSGTLDRPLLMQLRGQATPCRTQPCGCARASGQKSRGRFPARAFKPNSASMRRRHSWFSPEMSRPPKQ
ncbi:MAG: transcription antitermination protein NusB [Terriglobia bacterium]